MSDVFVAYDRADRDAAEQFVTTLKHLNYEVVWDADVQATDDWNERALQGIRECRCVVALWSPEAVMSDQVKFEGAAAKALGKLVSVTIGNGALPGVFGNSVSIDLSAWDHRSQPPEAELFFLALERVTRRKASRGHWLRMTGQAPPRPSASRRTKHAAAPTPVDRLPISAWWRWTASGVGLAGIAVTMFFLGGQLGSYMSRPTAEPAMARAVFSTSSAEAATPRARAFAGEENLATLAELERYSWQEVARRIGERLGADGGAALTAEAAAGNPAAKLETCVAHLRGIDGFAREAAREPCMASAAQNHPAGQFLVWVARDRVGVSHDDAREELVAAAEQGWAPAQQLLASYYRNAREGFARDPTRARTLLTAAAAKGYPRAMLDLSVNYLRNGDSEERELARTYLRRVMADREFSELCRPARQGLVALGEAPAACRRA